jgi:hypothetical protein
MDIFDKLLSFIFETKIGQILFTVSFTSIIFLLVKIWLNLPFIPFLIGALGSAIYFAVIGKNKRWL